jgi:hypothetical protein
VPEHLALVPGRRAASTSCRLSNAPACRLLHFADDGLSVRGIALALEQPQADHDEKVVDV